MADDKVIDITQRLKDSTALTAPELPWIANFAIYGDHTNTVQSVAYITEWSDDLPTDPLVRYPILATAMYSCMLGIRQMAADLGSPYGRPVAWAFVTDGDPDLTWWYSTELTVDQRAWAARRLRRIADQMEHVAADNDAPAPRPL